VECLSPRDGGCRLIVHISPNARSTALVGVTDGALHIRLAARPVEGAANKALIAWLARDLLRLPRSAVRIARGDRSRHKQVEIDAPAAAVAEAISAALSG
jgi:uncharacterized protein (TIGR00251 family)